MSADNGVYILRTPRKMKKNDDNSYSSQKGYEYRVTHCQAIDNVDYSDLYMPLLFGKSKVHFDIADAQAEARKMADGILEDDGILEYGIWMITKECQFPNMSSEEANIALAWEEGGETFSQKLERYMQLAQDTKKHFLFNKDDGKWYWMSGKDNINDPLNGPHPTFFDALCDALEPYTKEE